jgi:hypothetical protein
MFKKITFKNFDVVVEEKTKKNKFLLGDFVDIPGHFFFPARLFIAAHAKDDKTIEVLLRTNFQASDPVIAISSQVCYSDRSWILEKIKEAVIEYRKSDDTRLVDCSAL